MSRRVTHHDGREMTPLCHELMNALPRIDPENGDELIVTDDVEEAKLVFHEIMDRIGGHAYPAWAQNDRYDRQEAPDGRERVDWHMRHTVQSHADYAFIIRRRQGENYSFSALWRFNTQDVWWRMQAGHREVNQTLMRGLGRIGIIRVTTDIADLPPRRREFMESRGWTVEEVPEVAPQKYRQTFHRCTRVIPEEWRSHSQEIPK